MTSSTAKLGEVADVVRGVTYSANDVSDGPRDGYLPILRAGNIGEELSIGNDLVWVPANLIRVAQKIRQNDLVMCTSSGSAEVVGKLAKAPQDWDGSFGAFCAVVRSRDGKSDPAYLAHFLRSPSFKLWTKKSLGANIKNIRKSELEEFEVPSPPIIEQRRIAAILDKTDAIRRKRLLALKLAGDYLGSAFLDMCQSTVNVTLLSEIADVITGFAFQSESYTSEATGIRLIRGTNVGTGQFDWSETAFYPKALTSNLEKFSIRAGDVLLAMDRPWISSGLKCCIANTDVEGDLLVQRVARIRPHSEMDSEFMFRCLNSHQFIRHCRVTETTIPHISPRDLANFPVPDIDPSEKERFGKLAWRTREMTSKMSFHLAESTQAFNALSHRAFSGQL